MDVDSAHDAAGHGLHGAHDGLLGVLRHLGNGDAVLHHHIQVQRYRVAGHVDPYAPGALLGALFVHQIGDAAAHAGHHAGDALHFPDGPHGDGGDDLLRDMDAAALLRQGQVIPVLTHHAIRSLSFVPEPPEGGTVPYYSKLNIPWTG